MQFPATGPSPFAVPETGELCRANAAMLHKGLQVVWHYTYSTGDCFYASVSYLTQHLPHSHGVRRRLSMEEVRTIAAREVYQRQGHGDSHPSLCPPSSPLQGRARERERERETHT
jgi:hypothetical protein